jgi:inorganic triphosphatase YgiF
MRLQDNLEVELKLSVIGQHPDALLDDLAQLDELGGLRLGPPAEHHLRDVYWDLPDGGLRIQKLSLRLRQIDDRVVFTAKGGTSNSEGIFRRYELEVPATCENWQEVRAALVNEGVTLGVEASGEAPEGWLRQAGLVVTQDRRTRRTVKYAYADPHLDRPLVEIALDRTRFEFERIHVDYWEIEVEQLHGVEGSESAPRVLGRALLDRYAGRLELSTMGKYSRGLLIERELRETGQL